MNAFGNRGGMGKGARPSFGVARPMKGAPANTAKDAHSPESEEKSLPSPDELEKAESFGADILKMCVEVGGVLTGEHGVGVEKRDLMGEMFTQADLEQQQRVKCAFDPKGLMNPGKMFPTLHRCAELGRMHVHRGQLPFPDIPRF